MISNIKTRFYQYLIKKTDFLSVKDGMKEDQLRAYVIDEIKNFCHQNSFDLTETQATMLVREIVGSVVSYGPLRPLMEDQTITEVMVNGPRTIYIQRGGHITLSDAKFDDDQHLLHTIQKILAASGSSRRVDESSPYVDFSLRDGARVNVILPPVSMIGPVMTIRKFATDITTIDDLLNKGMLDKSMAVLLVMAIKAKLNIVFCGATGTGKTTLLNVLSRHIPQHERIVTIEDTAELRLLQEHVVSLQTKMANIEGKGEVTFANLFINSLRMRPDRIILGEVRGKEALDMIQAINSGHDGSLAIVHAGSPQECFNRLVTLMMMSGVQLSSEEIRKQIAQSIDLIVSVELSIDGKRRVTGITDVRYNPDETCALEDIFTFEQQKIDENGQVIGTWTMNKGKPSFYGKLVKQNVEIPQGYFEA